MASGGRKPWFGSPLAPNGAVVGSGTPHDSEDAASVGMVQASSFRKKVGGPSRR